MHTVSQHDESIQGKPTVLPSTGMGIGKKVYIVSYGCQMNFSESEIVASILHNNGCQTTADLQEADVIFVNTCSVRENAELRVRQRFTEFKSLKKHKPHLIVGVLGCMAERLKDKFLEEEKLVDLVVGPDSYRKLPDLLMSVEDGKKGIEVLLSLEETYADISPVRLSGNGITAFISITRGCDNMCTFCVVPFTRGRERSRNPETIIEEAKDLYQQGYKEIMLLGQNINSYLWYGGGPKKEFKHLSEEEKTQSVNFASLLNRVAMISPQMRIRYTTSNPQDMTDDVLEIMASHPNICRYIHLPVQSGNTNVLQRMNRGYSREAYLNRIAAIRRYMPDCAISTDIISGFCGETEEEHADTISLMRQVGFDYAYMFKYSERPNTMAQRKFADDVLEDVKGRRLQQIIDLQNKLSLESNQRDIGKTFEVLVEGVSKKDENELYGRNSQNKVFVFPKQNLIPGDYVWVKALDCTSATIKGEIVNVEAHV
ncbi:MAG: tRNA (N6-isopentenyl adenosine(37)-C2)-methylthiotransferase MiaB [Flavobacteriales bacterium]|nr:tRNA (N6-isopentenyl adenosine(37)-C2)-methylthiotransferase MiaB [Flavobacteriales bacterium]